MKSLHYDKIYKILASCKTADHMNCMITWIHTCAERKHITFIEYLDLSYVMDEVKLRIRYR